MDGLRELVEFVTSVAGILDGRQELLVCRAVPQRVAGKRRATGGGARDRDRFPAQAEYAQGRSGETNPGEAGRSSGVGVHPPWNPARPTSRGTTRTSRIGRGRSRSPTGWRSSGFTIVWTRWHAASVRFIASPLEALDWIAKATYHAPHLRVRNPEILRAEFTG